MGRRKWVSIWHTSSGELLAEGPVGWQIMLFEGNYYISNKRLKTTYFKSNLVPGLCIKKFFYVWLNYNNPAHPRVKNLGWRYILPNPLFPFIWSRVAVPANHPELTIERSAQKDS